MFTRIEPQTYQCDNCDSVNSITSEVVPDLVGFGQQVVSSCRWCGFTTVEDADEELTYATYADRYGVEPWSIDY